MTDPVEKVSQETMLAQFKERLQNLIHGAICKPYRSEGEGFLKSELGSVDYLIDLNKGFAEIKNIYHPKDKVLKNAEIFERINPLKCCQNNLFPLQFLILGQSKWSQTYLNQLLSKH